MSFYHGLGMFIFNMSALLIGAIIGGVNAASGGGSLVCGGGSAYFGGSFACPSTASICNCAGGGGGSGYTGGSGSYTTSNVATYTGNGKTPPSQLTSSTYYTSGLSAGGTNGTTNANSGNNHYGGHGRVVLVFIAPIP